MNPKKDRPASLTPSLLARKGEAAPSRLADGSAPRDVMALHEEIVARLASEIEQEGVAPSDASGGDDGENTVEQLAARERVEPRFDFDTAPRAVMAPVVVLDADDHPYEDDTHFDYEDAEDDVPAATRHGASPAHEDGVTDATEAPVAAAPARMEPLVASRAAPAKAVPAPFVTLRPSDTAAADDTSRTTVRAERVVASLPAAFAVMVAIAIGGGVGLWFADGMNKRAQQGTPEPVVVADAAVTDAGDTVAPLPVPATGDVAVAPIEAPAAPRSGTSIPAAPAAAAAGAPMLVPAPAHVAAPKATASTPALNGAFGVQLLASPLEQDAVAAWDRLSAKHSAALAALPHEVVRADLGAKGVFYRLRAGSFASRAEAKAVCTKLAAVKQDCMVIKR